jgi:Tol biopolymer transport system component
MDNLFYSADTQRHETTWLAQPSDISFWIMAFMKNFSRLVLLAASLILHTYAFRSEAQSNTPVAIPTDKLAFVTSKGFGWAGKIVVIAGQHRTTTVAYKTRELEFLSDGGRIIYSANDVAAHGIFVYDLKSHASTALLTNIAGAEAPCVSPDGSKIAFELYQDGRKGSDIYTANLDGTEKKQLTQDQSYNWLPRWSPDGTKLMFETMRNESPTNHVQNGGHRDVYVMDNNGTNQTNLTVNAYGHHPSWSPDGKFIAFMAYGGVWVMKADGSAKQNISHGKTRDSEPVWSPDGQWIAFTRTAKNISGQEAMDIWIMKSDGTEQRQVTFNQDGYTSYSPSWSK